jgi:hypothetical protein
MAKFLDVRVQVNTQNFTAKNRRQQREINRLPERAAQYFVAQTPVRSGNARRNTQLENQDTIHADYAYAERLDTGWSRQAPRGMTRPTEEWVLREYRKIFGKK